MNLNKFFASLCMLFIGFFSAEAVATESLPVANFISLERSVAEMNGTIELRLVFSRDFSGHLEFSVDGTAELGRDFEVQQSVVAPVGQVREAGIVIKLRDDALVEDTETIRITLRPSEGVNVGPDAEHTVRIEDNDTNWLVVHDVDGMRFDYYMQIIRVDGTITAGAMSDGGNGLPAGTWPVELDTANGKQFEAVVGPIPIEAGRTLLGLELGRTFTLSAESPGDDYSFSYGRPLIGTVTETWIAGEDAIHLTRGDPISGTFLLTRVGPNPIPTNNVKGMAAVPANRESEHKCGAADKSGLSDFTVKPRFQNPEPAFVGQPFARSTSRDSLIAAGIIAEAEIIGELGSRHSVQTTFAQPFALPVYPAFIDKTLDRARVALYYDYAQTRMEKDAAAFRYKSLLYETGVADAETYIRARFDKIEDMWDCSARERAYRTARELISLLRYAPTNRALRSALLDIYYDMAVADKALAQENLVAVAEMMIKGPLAPGQQLIDKEIAALEKVVSLYRRAFAVYATAMRYTFGVDVSSYDPELLNDEPFAYHIFREDVPTRSPYAALFRNADGEWALPNLATVVERPKLFEGYKDVTLLFELLRDYLRGAEQLTKRYVLRRQPGDVQRADILIGDALLATWLEGHALLAMFPEIHDADSWLDSASRLREAVAGWRHTYTALGHIRRFLTGDTNLLGFTDDFLVRTQSTIAGDQQAAFFHSYDYVATYLTEERGPLKRAEEDLKIAQAYYDNYRDRSDQLAQQFADRAEQYDLRLREIVGVSPGESGYDNPRNNDGGLIKQQLLSIELSRLSIEESTLAFQNLEQEIRIEIRRRGEAAEINDAISHVYLDFVGADINDLDDIEDELETRNHLELTMQLAEINADQTFWNNMASAAASVSVSGGVDLRIVNFGGSVSGGAIAYPINAGYQRDQETAKGLLAAAKERLDALQRASVQSLQGKLLNVDSQAQVKLLLLRMGQLQLQSAKSAIALRQQMAILEALYLEKDDLERRKAESNEGLADRYFADPSHRLVKDAYLLQAESSFAGAQRWMFLVIRTAEYKWNQPFKYITAEGVTFTMQTLFRARSALELSQLFNALDEWDKHIAIGTVNDDGEKVFSIREDFFGYVEGGNYYDHATGELLDAAEAFKRFLAKADNYLDPGESDNPFDDARVLKLRFSTAFTPTTGGLFLRNRWLEKVRFLRVMLVGGSPLGFESKVDGYLEYGGLSLIRNQIPGSQHTEGSDRLMDEFTVYPTGHWFFYDGRWQKQKTFGTYIGVQVSTDPRAKLSTYEIDTFRELSVAATEWTLYIAVERDGRALIDVGDLLDIQFRLHFYWYARPVSVH